MTPFSARNRLGAPSASDWGHFPAWEAVGIPFRAGNDTFFCSEPPRSPFRAGLGAFSCPGGGRYPIPRRKRHLFLLGTASEPLPRRIWVIFLPGRQEVSLSVQEKIPFSAQSCLGAPSAPDLGHFPAREAGGILFRAGKDTFFCPELPRSPFCAGFGAFSCPGGGWYPLPRRK